MYKRTNVLMFQGTIAKTINESVYIVAFQLLRAGSEDIKITGLVKTEVAITK